MTDTQPAATGELPNISAKGAPVLTWTNTRVKLGELKPWQGNPRQSTKAQAKKILKSFDEFGQVETVAVGPGFEVYDGHQRLSALFVVHGAEYEIDARQSSRALTEDERKRLVLALHAGAVGSWDWDIVSSWDAPLLMENGLDADTLKDWKRDTAALDNFLKSEQVEPADAEPQVDRAAELQEVWRVKRGDLWQIGEHRLLCGDSFSEDSLDVLVGVEKIDACISDPPYGIDFDTDYTRFTIQSGKNNKYAPIVNDDKPFDPAPYLKYESVVLWGANYFAENLPRGTWLIWDKRFDNGKAWLSDAEIAWMKTGTGVYIYSLTSQGFVRPEKVEHPTQKAVALMQWCIEKSKAGLVIYDPFAGSGTTLVACQNLSRKCRAIEISENYCAVILQRMSDAFPHLEIKRLD